MKLKEMTLTPNSEGDTLPKTVTVEMTLEEALWIAVVAGQQKGTSPHNGLYDCLVCDVFNRYWEDGVDDAQRELQVETPPIKYD